MDAKDEQPKSRGNATGTVNSIFGFHVLSMIDLLGQSTELATWDYLPKSDVEFKKWIEGVRRSMGRVMAWRGLFERTFSQFMEMVRRHDEQILQTIPADRRREFQEFREFAIHSQHFSDSLIFYSPVENRYRQIQLSSVLGMIVACGGLLLGALKSKNVFRGAIELGILGHFPDHPDGRRGDPYGPALASAHNLESKKAGYPRILVGPRLLKYLSNTSALPEQDGAVGVNKAIATTCLGLLTKDTDGCWIIDYLGDGFAAFVDDQAANDALRNEALDFVNSELTRFRSEMDTKLTERYEKLAAYFERRGYSKSLRES